MRIKQRARTPRTSDGTCTPSTALPETARLTLENTRISTENTHLREQVARLSAENTRLTVENEELIQCCNGLRAAEKKSQRLLQKRGELAEQDEDVAKDLRVGDLHVEGWVEESEGLKRKVARIEEELGCLRAAGRVVATVVADDDGHRAAPGLLGAEAGAGAGAGAENTELSAADGPSSAEEVASIRMRLEPASTSTYLEAPKEHDVCLDKTYPHQLQNTSTPAPQLDHKVSQFPPTNIPADQESISQGNPEAAQAGIGLATMREQLERVRAELQRVTAEKEALDAPQKENAGHKRPNRENAPLLKYIVELEGKLKKQTSKARAAEESLSQMAIRLLAAMNGHDAAEAEKKDLQSRNMELASELERTRKELTSELATAKTDIKFKGCEIANLKSRNTQRSQLLRAVQDELEMRRLNDEELMEENERILSLLARANEANEANETKKVNGQNEIDEGNEGNESNEENGGNDAEEVNQINEVNGVNEEQKSNEKNDENEKNEGNDGNEGNENQIKELAEEVMEEVNDVELLDSSDDSQRKVDEIDILR
ncbi:uncharacterized protein LAJ45_08968 [Morchella importuna]|uniref:uncharacterized protein n=1 Tax=Morchella importuna TaxID=1174673 RepID=UPI001E8E7564|nr:uncharacterized protein LAJ45_08968 [Morchella importuna]KAH8146889.1 hypothetical protein LAJ45_08968 [Morchella importuna]